MNLKSLAKNKLNFKANILCYAFRWLINMQKLCLKISFYYTKMIVLNIKYYISVLYNFSISLIRIIHNNRNEYQKGRDRLYIFRSEHKF
jgi:hypothetical protein